MTTVAILALDEIREAFDHLASGLKRCRVGWTGPLDG